ncbi:fumarate reductase cytochrome b subunit [Sinimarinibacterium sp. CAU 1509]|uniref:fumarate reductase cytochrome b subunit n=1 Tax=Sinimarinibacterium sp. CAU 1509 TaxID=2562283 RepID=UPI001B7FAA7E|nr:fumarate reductase cytochrome b subunit [Sinimarinibacterium sp. CAU 1509]
MHRKAELAVPAAMAVRPRSSRMPAQLDVLQSATGVVLALFMWGHMFFVASILVSKDFMWAVTRMFEGYFFFGRSYPGVVSTLVGGILLLFVAHAALAMRKFPANYQQYRLFMSHRAAMRHEDTSLWVVQIATGFALFFLVSIHLYQMLMHPGDIGPYASSDRVWSGRWWPLYLVMLFCVELHGGIGLSRVAAKWGWFASATARQTRRRLKLLKWGVTAFLLALGLTTLAAYMKIGHEHAAQAGERYTPEQYRSVTP